jgi:hypothetical protein
LKVAVTEHNYISLMEEHTQADKSIVVETAVEMNTKEMAVWCTANGRR